MEAAVTLPVGPTPGLFAEIGGAMFRRATWILGDEIAAARVAEELFVRFVVHGNPRGQDVRARWNWIFRVVTSHALRQLPDDARPGAAAADSGERGSPPDEVLPDMQTLRRMDEATQNIVVLATLDGLGPDEIAEVLGLPVDRIRRRLADQRTKQPPRGSAADPDRARPTGHPSTLALDRDRAAHAEHIATCDRCRAMVARGDRLAEHFARDIAPAIVPRVAAAVREERARQATGPRWKRLLWLAGGLALVSGLALLVARPHSPDRTDIPYAGLKGASRARAAGIQISVGRGAEVRPLDPGTAVVPGDRLYFRVRTERPRYLELRVHDRSGERRFFPVGPGDAVEVRPGQALPGEYLVGAAEAPREGSPGAPQPAKIWIVGLFSDHPFPLDGAPGPDVEVLPVRIDVEAP